jgi:hypothetical protein
MAWLCIERHLYENSERKSLAVYMEVATACATTNNDYIMKAANLQRKGIFIYEKQFHKHFLEAQPHKDKGPLISSLRAVSIHEH